MSQEPIAIIGIGCRFPGADSPKAFWELLTRGEDAVREVPAERWNVDDLYDPDASKAGKMTTRWGGFLDGISAFDAPFFRISPREAARMDPQHRLLLETSWEALEDAGLVPETLAGSKTGVFVGIANSDASRLHLHDPHGIDVHTNTGSAYSIAANRLSYVYDFRGPSLAVDTACSSSLVAVHLACQSLRSGESTLALAGGVNLILTPEITIGFSRLAAMAPDGRCKAFDAKANGYVRSEGVGIVALKLLSQALADGDPLIALIQGSAVNQDGRSNGLTAPNRWAQEAVIAEAYQKAGVSPGQVHYVEAHGTGTLLGDPIEAKALGAVLAKDRPEGQPCVLGSVKTNIGHTEAAAGVAGLIKVALALKQRQIPPNLHFSEPNPYIPFAELPLRVPTSLEAWPEGAAIAGVSSFGFGGTNAHVVLAEAPPRPERPPAASDALLVPLSAHGPESLTELAHRHLTLSASLQDRAYTASLRRSPLDHRLAVVASSEAEFQERLQAFLDGENVTGVVQGRKLPRKAQKLVFVFPGQGSQWLGMGRELLATEPVFREAIAHCDAAMRPYSEGSLLERLESPETTWQDAIDQVQPALFAIQVALAALWRSWGIVPAAVAGHSMGEVAAAHVAGILSLDDAARIICLRSRLMRRCSGLGAMAMVELTLAEAQEALVGLEEKLSVAVSNGPRSTVLSGDPEALRTVMERLEARGVFCRLVKVDVASHSPQMDALRDDLLDALSPIQPQRAVIPFMSTVEGQKVDGAGLDAAYWMRNLREPVLFETAVRMLAAEGLTRFLEISPHPVLTNAVADCLRHFGVEGKALSSTRRDLERSAILETLGLLYVEGFPVDWKSVAPAGECTTLPTLPWQREVYRIVPAATPRPQSGHALLGPRLSSSVQPGTSFWEKDLSVELLPYLADHAVLGKPVLPGTAYVEMAVAAFQEAFGPGPVTLTGLRFKKAMLVPTEGALRVQTVLTRDGETTSFSISSLHGSDWTLHATGTIARATAAEAPPQDVEAIQARCPKHVAGPELIRGLAESGLQYGPAFRGIEWLQAGTREALGRVTAPAAIAPDRDRYRVHPAMLDACLHVVAALLPEAGGTFLPVGIDSLTVHAHPGGEGWSHAVLHEFTPSGIRGDVTLLDAEGRPVVEIHGLRLKPLPKASDDGFYRLDWVSAPKPESVSQNPGNWLIVADAQGVGQALARLLETRSERVTRVDDVAEACDALTKTTFRGVIHLDSLDLNPLDLTDPLAPGTAGVASALRLAQELIRRPEPPRLWLVTSGVHPAGGLIPLSAAQAPLWGLGRSLANEHPELKTTLIDLEGSPPADDASALLGEILSASAEDQVCLRASGRYAAKLARYKAKAESVTLRADGTYLITGGLGGLGLEVAGWMAEHGAGNLVLVGRRAPSPEVAQRLDGLRAGGIRVDVVQADVSEADALRRLFAQMSDMPPLRGIVHAAGILADATVLQMDAQRLTTVMRPKVAGAWNLHQASLECELDFFALFSSAASLFGSPGQSNYAAANAYLDALAHLRRASGRVATSLNWGPFAQVGLAAQEANRGDRLALQGIGNLDPSRGMKAMARLLASSEAQVAVIPIDWRAFAGTARRLPLLQRMASGLLPANEARPATLDRAALAALPPEEARKHLETYLAGILSRVLRVPAPKIDPQRSLRELGIDSLMATELRNAVEADLSVGLSVVTFLEGHGLAALAGEILASLSGETARGPAIGWESEATLDDAILADGPPAGTPHDVFLTGATGFLGPYLLRDLLKETEATVHCLVRAESPEQGASRIREAMQAHGLWEDAFAPRIVAVVGDLAQPRFGLSEEAFDALSQRVDVLYHSGAQPNHLYPYAALRAVHVQGTQEVLRLASMGPVKPVHSLSTLNLFASEAYAESGVVTESDAPGHATELFGGYAQSKWVGDRLVTSANARGIPTTIYRPGFISGASKTGHANLSDMVCRLLKACIELEAAPDVEMAIDWVPVDVVSRAIVALSRRPEAAGRAYHLVHPEPLSWRSLVDGLRHRGYAIRLLPYADWKRDLLERAGKDPEHPLFPLVHMFTAGDAGPKPLLEMFFQGRMPHFECRETYRTLEGTVECPPLEALMETAFGYFVKTGFIPAPGGVVERR
ncbi:Phthiocerol/phenolphthiocerol synthesis polyketide synthase type I PpsA [compost metagenome]